MLFVRALSRDVFKARATIQNILQHDPTCKFFPLNRYVC